MTLHPHAEFRDAFWSGRLRTMMHHTLPGQHRVLQDTGRLRAFALAYETDPVHEPQSEFWDSDVAKWLEAACYAARENPELRPWIDQLMEIAERVQHHDGYLNSYYQKLCLEKRWSNLQVMHELYCAGHLMEAAVAHQETTGQDKFMQVICRYAEHIARTFGRNPGQKRGYPGHPEIELALVRMYEATGRTDLLDLARYFIDERGTSPNYFDLEREQLGPDAPTIHKLFGNLNYTQADMPIREQRKVEGHAVRAVYLYAGAAGVARYQKDKQLRRACDRLWRNMCGKRMYITGGIGSCARGERFSFDYDLPDETAFCETCAAIGLVFWARRMLDLELRENYAWPMERALYNAIPAGISLDGDRYFYENPLAVYPPANRAGFERRPPDQRQPWFACACCPPNIARLYGSLARYACGVTPRRELAFHLYIAGHYQLGDMEFRMTGNYPWQPDVGLDVVKGGHHTLALRLPSWCEKPALRLNGKKISMATIRHGYLRITRDWQPGDRIDLQLPLSTRIFEAHPSVRQSAGRVAVMRGPIVYCAEQVDNGADLADLALPVDAEFTESWRPRMLGGVVTLKTRAFSRPLSSWRGGPLYRPATTPEAERQITLVPYALWGNRSPGEMRVWLRKSSPTPTPPVTACTWTAPLSGPP